MYGIFATSFLTATRTELHGHRAPEARPERRETRPARAPFTWSMETRRQHGYSED